MNNKNKSKVAETPDEDPRGSVGGEIRVVIDGEVWVPENAETAQYDAIHTVAGAILAGADTVEVHQDE